VPMVDEEGASYFTPELITKLSPGSLSELATKVKQALTALSRRCADVSREDAERLNKEALDIIRHLVAITREGEERRSEFLKNALQVMAFVVAYITFALAVFGRGEALGTIGHVVTFLLCVSAAAFVFAAGVVLVYLFQHTFDLPYVLFTPKLGNSWKWFYYGAIDPETPDGFFPWKGYYDAYIPLYAQDLVRYVENFTTQTTQQQLRQNLQQLFLLIEHLRYIYHFEQQLAHVAIYGLLFVLAFIAGGVLVFVVRFAAGG